ncbi:hypothetical protein KFL_016390020 [Klebsormidium nitens]|uniref:Uncharacterized protein n=1 Tax=Klebsormidium nitens TaxID=105231 RepID=A0A1Y1IXQ3_KLENI|nr:hypothetical protein KFL_016390020 [Klebsormidium nitens]|eukprot:GAQ93547.1 hypothetical protein KFL_016390020 [Klebsormidium nitens]
MAAENTVIPARETVINGQVFLAPAIGQPRKRNDHVGSRIEQLYRSSSNGAWPKRLVKDLTTQPPLKQKRKVAKVTEHVINRLKLQSGKKLRSVGTDRGKEYIKKALKDVFGGKGTVHEKTAPYTAERLNWEL